MHTRITLLSLAALASLFVNNIAQAATITGQVSTEKGTNISGAIVTLWNEQRNQKESVYSDAKGHFTLNTKITGKVTLRGRTPYYADLNAPLTLTSNSMLKQDFTLTRLTSPEEISASLPASAHVSTLSFRDPEDKDAFVSQCNYCHQQGNSLTRAPRSSEAWSETVRRMEGFGAFITYGEHKEIVETLSDGFNGKPIDVQQHYDFSDELAQAKVTEWLVGTPMGFIHDTFVGQDEKLYGMDEGTDSIVVLDRETGEVKEHKIDADGVPISGKFQGFKLNLGIFTGSHGPHSMAQIDDGRMYITASLSGRLLMFDPKTEKFTHYEIPEGFLWRKGKYPHTIRADKDNNVWFTVVMSNTVMKFNTTTNTFTDIALPSDGAMSWLSDAFLGAVMKISSLFPQENVQLALSHHKWLNGGKEIMSWPYGIDISPIDGSIWYAKLLANKIGRIDPQSLEITEFDTPYRGPRRMRMAKDGTLWIPSFDEGYLMHFDPKTSKFENIPLPLLSENEYEVPYALNVHPTTGDIWIAANNSDRVIRYIPGEKRFINYPMPSHVVWFRDFEFTEEGEVCTSNSNLPAYAHEDGLPAFVCIDPEANTLAPEVNTLSAQTN